MNIEIEDLSTSPQHSSGVSDNPSESMLHLAIADRFNITNPTKDEENKLSEIWDFAMGMSKTKEITDVIWQVVNLEGVVGSPQLGETRLDKLYKYAKLRRQERHIQEELKGVVGAQISRHF